ncbi:MAG: PEGA domain-containing protein, partial [bacterium]
IYALGLCLYESLAGRPVHERLPTDLNSAWLAFQKRLRKPLELTFESDAFRQYPRLRAVILKSLAARPVDRYRSAAEMRKDLEDILAGKGYDDVNADEANLELTNATLHSLAEDDVLHAPEPGATQATRPLDGVGVTQLAPEGLLAAGKAEAERRKRRKRLITVSALAAGTLAVVGIGGWLISGVIARSAATTAQKMEQAIQGVEQAVGEMKDPVPSATYVRSLGQAYEEAVRTGRKYPELGSRIDEQCRMMRKAGVALPAEFKRSFDAALTADKTEKAAKILKEWETLATFADIMGITAQQFGERREAMKNAMARSDIQRELAALRQAIPETVLDDSSLDKGEAAAGRLKALRDRPWPGYDEGEKQQQLGALASTLSDRAMPYIAGLRDAALGRYRAGQDGDSERDALIHFGETNPALAWVIQASYLDARNSVETARQSRLVAGGLRKVLDHAASARDLAGVQAVVAELAALEKASGGRIPLTQIKSAEEALSAKYLFIAEGYAQGAKSAFDAGKADEAEKAQRELVTFMAVTPDRFGKSALVGLLQDVEGRRAAYLTRQSDALALQRKAKLQAEEAARNIPSTPTNKESAVSKGKGALDIRVSPKTAMITVDGTVATSGRIEVTPDENHKVMVEASGYKECLQYYKVRAGETRKIDILLEKMVKKSFFGL